MVRKHRTHFIYLSPAQLAALDAAMRRDDTEKVAELDSIAQERKMVHEAKKRTKRKKIIGAVAVAVAAVIVLLIVQPWAPKRVGPCVDDRVDPDRYVKIDKMAPNTTGWIVPWDLERDDSGNYRLKPIGDALQGIEGEGHFCLLRTTSGFEVWGNPKEVTEEVHEATEWVIVTLHP